MKQILALFIILAIFLAGCNAAVVNEQPEIGRKSFERKEQILAAIGELELESYTRNLTPEDIRGIELVLPLEDHAMEDFYLETLWLAEHNQGEHIGHSLSFIYSYVETGEPLICVPHEIDHLKLYIAFNDTDRIEHAAQASNNGYEDWVRQSEEARKLLPAYYRDFDRLKQEAKLAIEKAEQKDYQGALPHIEYVSLHQVC
ncbi:hypothetical protein HYV81_04285 [Candidatus Woesearchaeota archaeon]|nr:hypothetical protein [Candidatus Woesearchaeota archaeon]